MKPKLVYCRWQDACTDEAPDAGHLEPLLSDLEEVGWLLAQNDEAITIGMEIDFQDGEPTAGRWRLHIPWGQIISLKTIDVERAFNKKAKTVV